MFAPLLLLGVFNMIFYAHMKCTVDRGWALCVLTEQSLRDGKINRRELSHAPFGFTGWQLYPYYITHEGRDDMHLEGFLRYLTPGAVRIEPAYPAFLSRLPPFRHESPGDPSKLIASGEFNYFWFFKAKFSLERARAESDSSSEYALPPTDEHFEKFPLNNQEWLDYISRG